MIQPLEKYIDGPNIGQMLLLLEVKLEYPLPYLHVEGGTRAFPTSRCSEIFLPDIRQWLCEKNRRPWKVIYDWQLGAGFQARRTASHYIQALSQLLSLSRTRVTSRLLQNSISFKAYWPTSMVVWKVSVITSAMAFSFLFSSLLVIQGGIVRCDVM